MSTLRLGDEAPNFTAQTTEGEVDFHQYLGDGWGILFSHPADYTPVCTTELGATAKLKEEFDKRNVKVIALARCELIRVNCPATSRATLLLRCLLWRFLRRFLRRFLWRFLWRFL